MNQLLSRFLAFTRKRNVPFIAITFFLIAFTAQVLSPNLFAQTTGKIAGRVTDKKTGEGMIGTNVYLDGTILGASTDIDGFYVILNVPPGTYALIVEQIGYQKAVVQNVESRVNSTTTVNVQLSEAAVEGEEVVVVAERPLIPKDKTSSKEVVSKEEIDLLPVTNFDQVVGLQGGVVNGRFRGGRSDEVLYMIDGIPVNSAATGGRAATVGIEAVENLEVISGIFNAEYGRAMSGVVNAVTKEGSKEYHGNLEFYNGDYYSTYSLLGFNVYPQHTSPGLDGIRDIRGSLEGPVPFTNNKLSFVVSGGSAKNDGYLNGHGRNLFLPNTIHDAEAITAALENPASENPRADAINAFNITGDQSDAPQNTWWGYDLLTKVYFPFLSSTSLSYSYLINRSSWRDYNGFRRFAPEGRTRNFGESDNHIVSLKHVFGAKAFGTFKVAYLDEKFETHLAEDPLGSAYLPGVYSQQSLTNNIFAVGGTDLFDFRRGSQTLTLKSDVIWQLHRQHEVKTGFEYLDYTINEDSKTILFADSATFNTEFGAGLIDDGAWRHRPIHDDLVDVDFQYYHNDTAGDRHIIKDQKAAQAGVYIQDKMEFSAVVINAGLRFDYFDPKGLVPKDLNDPNGSIAYPDLSREEQLKRALKKADVQSQLSPRLGLAYQVTSNGIIHFSYGHFFQIPALQNLYTNPNFRILPGTVSQLILGNADLKAQRTVSYELAYSELITEGIAAEVTVYYRDIYDLLGIELLSTLNDQRYVRWTNVDYGNVKGAIFSLNLSAQNFSANLDYTFQVASGNASDPTAAFTAAQAGKRPNLEAIRLDWDQRHTIVGTINYFTDKFSASLISRFGSGNPFDYTPLPAPGRPILTDTDNNGQMPPNFSIDLNAGYNFAKIGGVNVKAYLQAYNILDNRNPAFVFSDSGSPSSTANLERSRRSLEQALLLPPEQIIFDGTSFVPPREVRFGLGFKF